MTETAEAVPYKRTEDGFIVEYEKPQITNAKSGDDLDISKTQDINSPSPEGWGVELKQEEEAPSRHLDLKGGMEIIDMLHRSVVGLPKEAAALKEAYQEGYVSPTRGRLDIRLDELQIVAVDAIRSLPDFEHMTREDVLLHALAHLHSSTFAGLSGIEQR